MENKDFILEMKKYAEENHVPIITDDGLDYLLNYIKKNHIKKILEIGTAIGYSAICMCLVSPDISIVSVERDENRYLEAVKNVKRAHLEDRIELIYRDALEVSLDETFDLIFIDAAKAQNTRFFEKFSLNLEENGTIITDNMNFHGFVFQDEKDIASRNLRQLVRKVKDYKIFLQDHPKFRTEFLDLGDGLAISVKK